MKKMKKVSLLALSLITTVSLVACNNEDDGLTSVENERNIIEQRNADKNASADLLSKDIGDITSLKEYGLNLENETDFGLNVSPSLMNNDELMVWNMLNEVDTHDIVTYDITRKMFFITSSEYNSKQTLYTMIEKESLWNQQVENYATLNAAINEDNQGYTLVMLNPDYVYNALFVINPQGTIEYNVLD